jgi:predicted RNA binding protein YcfA (HicA-like mRNA interferase family)
MNKLEKLINKFQQTQHGHTFEDCKKVLELMGYMEVSSRGSHHKFSKSNLIRPVIIAKHRPIHPEAIKDILRIYEGECHEKK